MNRRFVTAMFLLLFADMYAHAGGKNYKNFDVTTYATVRDVVQMKDPVYLESRWAAMSKYVKFDKVYLETSRDMIVADQASLDSGKRFFIGKGLKVSGGITWTVDEHNGVTFCYSDPAQREKAREIIQLTARNFDEILFDDWGFTNCKTDDAIAAKGMQSWSQYRLALMDKVGRELVDAAKAVNPRVQVIIKYPQCTTIFRKRVLTWRRSRSTSTVSIRVPRPAIRSTTPCRSSSITATRSRGISAT